MNAREPHSAFVELLDRLLDRGVYLRADLIVSVAGVPLLGASVQALLGGMETLLDYGVFRDWDAAIRAEPRRPAPYLLQSPAALWRRGQAAGDWLRGTLVISRNDLRMQGSDGTQCLCVPYSDVKGAFVQLARAGPSASAAFLRLSLQEEDVWLHVHHLRSLLSVLRQQGFDVPLPGELGE